MGSTRREEWCDISTNTLLAEGDVSKLPKLLVAYISTNTLLAEGDDAEMRQGGCDGDFNQHPPRGG